MPLEWNLLISFCIFLIYLCLFFIWHNLVPMSIILCCFELGGVCGGCVCVWVHVYLDVGLGREGSGLDLLFFLCCVWVGVGICLEKCPVILDVLFLLYMLSLLHSIIGAFGSMVGKIFGLGLCSSCRFSASLFGIYATSIFTLQVTYFRALPHSLEYIFQYIFLSLMILNIMHHVHDCM